ncbi:MAG: DUF1289 domain-containing protein [Thiomonas sp.]|nr:DUF1289 domain-containing protein [Thiomonas sp.]
MTVPSPCINVCSMDEATGLCRGCARTLDEIARWASMKEQDKLRVWRLIRLRQTAATASGDAPSGPQSPSA